MGRDKELTCPCCGEQFTKTEACWTVCLDCGHITPPGEDSSEHGPGLRKATENTDRIWPCNTAVRVYTEEAAVQKQKEIQEES